MSAVTTARKRRKHLNSSFTCHVRKAPRIFYPCEANSMDSMTTAFSASAQKCCLAHWSGKKRVAHGFRTARWKANKKYRPHIPEPKACQSWKPLPLSRVQFKYDLLNNSRNRINKIVQHLLSCWRRTSPWLLYTQKNKYILYIPINRHP